MLVIRTCALQFVILRGQQYTLCWDLVGTKMDWKGGGDVEYWLSSAGKRTVFTRRGLFVVGQPYCHQPVWDEIHSRERLDLFCVGRFARRLKAEHCRPHKPSTPHTVTQMAVGQNQWYHFGVGAPPILVYFSGDWDVHWGYDLGFDPWPDSGACGRPPKFLDAKSSAGTAHVSWCQSTACSGRKGA